MPRCPRMLLCAGPNTCFQARSRSGIAASKPELTGIVQAGNIDVNWRDFRAGNASAAPTKK